MDFKDYEKRLLEIRARSNNEQNRLAAEYALSNNSVKQGDVVEDHIGKVIVDIIKVHMSYDKVPACVYTGIELTKKGVPNKRGVKRSVYQSNLKENNNA